MPFKNLFAKKVIKYIMLLIFTTINQGIIMFKKILIPTIAIMTLSSVFGQDKNTIYSEAAGVGLLYSFNYERNITDKITARIGWSLSLIHI